MQSESLNSPIKKYKFCPICGGEFKNPVGNQLKCQKCSYNYFVNQAPTAGVLIFDNEGKVLLAKRKFEPKKGTWQSVGGFVGLDESLEDALKREAKEELGVEIKLKHFLGSFPENYEFSGISVPFLAIYFEAEIIKGNPQPSDDVAQIRYFSADELKTIDITYPGLKDLINNK